MKSLKTYLIVCLLMETARTSDIAYCEKDGLSCTSVNTNSSPILKIKSWWKEMSVQKPLKCRTVILDSPIANFQCL